MAKKQECRCKAAECEECPEWIFTFADLVMLMMGFFVILWVLKPNPGKKNDSQAQDDWVKTVASIRESFGYIPAADSKDPVDVQVRKLQLMKMPKPPGQGAGAGGETIHRRDGAEGTDPQVTTIRSGKQLAVGGKMLFDRGDPALPALMRGALDDIATQIRGHRNIVMIKGHTALDDLPDTATAQQRMDLSLRRAQAVADYLVSKGVEPEILRVQGCSTFEPVVQREYTPTSQSLNRRAEVEVTATLVGELKASKAE